MQLYFHNEKLLYGKIPTDLPPPIETYIDFDGETIELGELTSRDIEAINGDFRLLSLRDVYKEISPDLYAKAQHGYQILHWRREYHFCPQCGKPLIRESKPEKVMRCQNCQKDYYPRINPAIIVAITCNDKILLAERQMPTGNFYSLIAGFVEPGETIEDAVRREVMEEVGIELDTLSYVSSQPWPFPNNLMLGFEATAKDTDLSPDGEEVKNAGWFAHNGMPANLPQPLSIARKLINRWLKKMESSND